MKSRETCIYLFCTALALVPVTSTLAQSGGEPFHSASSVDEVRRQIEKLPGMPFQDALSLETAQ